MRRVSHAVLSLFVVGMCSALASAQTVKVTRNVNLRPDPSSEYPPIRLLTPSEPPMTLVDPAPDGNYFHVKTAAGEDGFVWGRNVQVSVSPNVTAETVQPGPGIPGSASTYGCGDGLWEHVYHPYRLLVRQGCITVTGKIVDATAHQSHHQADGVRHEADGDTHGWLQVDPQFANLINGGNVSHNEGNLVFELVCHYPVTQTDVKPACDGYGDHTTIPPVGTHVAIRGTFVQERNHQKWNEIHPVSSIVAQ